LLKQVQRPQAPTFEIALLRPEIDLQTNKNTEDDNADLNGDRNPVLTAESISQTLKNHGYLGMPVAYLA
jgi:hypothetical protein